jgi:threonine dehydrogenase-like Zn-dependent dehydrogenase
MSAPDYHHHRKTMRGVIWQGKPFEVTVTDLPFPKVQAADDAVVQITSSAICGTDLHIYHGIFGSARVPYNLGHEAVGIVREVGSAVGHFKPGDRVVVSWEVSERTIPSPPTLLPVLHAFGAGSDFGSDKGLHC